MRLAFYAPFKPLGHPHPSGDLTIGAGLVAFLQNAGHQVLIPSQLRTRWIYLRPWRWPRVLVEGVRARRRVGRFRPQVWLTYHTYYKGPDLLGPLVSRQAGIPYVIFQGMYATRRRRHLKTKAGFYLNRHALLAARHVFLNRLEDLENLRRLLPEERLTYVPPGIFPEGFRFDPRARERLRREWGAGDERVVLAAAMFRPGVKTRGLVWVIEACARLRDKGLPLFLAIAGDGRERETLRELAARRLGGRVRFVGQLPREGMHRFYSAGDLFAFPGFGESLGMVFLEAQSCGLPVTAFHTGGIPEVVADGRSGFLVPPGDFEAFTRKMELLIRNPGLCWQMGQAAAAHVRERHDLDRNYREMESKLLSLIQGGRAGCRSRRP